MRQEKSLTNLVTARKGRF